MVGKCCTLLRHNVLQVEEVDRWQWLLDPSKSYLDNGVDHMLRTIKLPLTPIVLDSIWHKSALLKVTLFVRRLLRNQIPTKDNLLRCNIIQQDFVLCVSGCGAEELIDHFGSI